jgi:hypothetical protein
MSEYIKILEKLNDLEVSIIRATKINKVLKAILKLDTIPKEEEFKFKPRSQALLDRWNKLMDGESGATNGVNGSTETKKKSESNGTKTETPDAKESETAAADGKEEKPSAPQEEAKAAEEPAKADAVSRTSIAQVDRRLTWIQPAATSEAVEATA